MPRILARARAIKQPFGGTIKLQVVVCLLALVSFFGAAAQAQDEPKFDVFAGYSYVRANPATSGIDSFSMNGGSASIAYNANHWLSAVADFAAITRIIFLALELTGHSLRIFSAHAFPIATIHASLRLAGCFLASRTLVAITDWRFPLRIILLPWPSAVAWTAKSLTVSQFVRCRWITS
jgi:hypothetical protein